MRGAGPAGQDRRRSGGPLGLVCDVAINSRRSRGGVGDPGGGEYLEHGRRPGAWAAPAIPEWSVLLWDKNVILRSSGMTCMRRSEAESGKADLRSRTNRIGQLPREHHD